ncbi:MULTISPECIES: citryl-CoA lyase [unclassified Sinorhizobium]|uniref:citryl-CoA lyase n=1 Tax=unclassified Sinorhizobium TaxID=2613772 RepID=UPI0024C457A3|nr:MULTISPECIES: citryl-CoA lyase [unclassified Sinorhizobium]MDK1378546.1 citryl-CoA lyase [Sinorhizobium sp. 6-70]MDK1481929.1 citryl-CoA lyase [Sinorhizobium sp. 6-117]
MQIGKQRTATSRISTVSAERVEVRGRDLCRDLMGRLTFTEYFHLLATGREPTEEQRYFLDLLLIAIAEHGMMPTVQAARMTLAADPGSLQGALAAGLLGCGPVLVGTAELCGALLARAEAQIAGGEDADAVVRALVNDVRKAGGKLPGFGHPVHRPVDPRAERILELADQRGVSGTHVALARLMRTTAAEVWGKLLVMNVSMPIAAVLLDLGFPVTMIKAVPLLARSAGILAHLTEERANPIGFAMASAAEAAVIYRKDEEEGGG